MKNINHIEFIGPSGAGKSTLHRELTKSEPYYHGTHGTGFARKVFEQCEFPYTSIYRISPRFIREYIDNYILEDIFLEQAFIKYLSHNPSSLIAIHHILDDVKYNPTGAFMMIKRAIEDYQFGRDTLHSDDILVLDEGFAMAAASAAWRRSEFEFDNYFDCFPIPEILIHVNAPNEVCLQRQRNRNRLAVDREWVDDIEMAQESYNYHCENVTEYLSYHSTIVEINSVGPLSEVMMNLHTGLNNTGSDKDDM